MLPYDCDADGLSEGETELLGESDAEGLNDGEPELDGLSDGETELLGDSDGDRLDEGESEADGPSDGNPAANYALFEPDQEVITFNRIDYDQYTAADKVHKAGLPAELANRLLTGK